MRKRPSPDLAISLINSLPRSLTHLKLSGIRLVSTGHNVLLFENTPNLQELVLDLNIHSRHAKHLYTEAEAMAIVDRLGVSCRNLRALGLSVGDASFRLLEHVAKKLWMLEDLHLVGADTDGMIPTTGLYLRDITHDIVSCA